MTDENVNVSKGLQTVTFADNEGALLFSFGFKRVFEFNWNENAVAAYPMLVTREGGVLHPADDEDQKEKNASGMVLQYQSDPKRLDRCGSYLLTKDVLSGIISCKGAHCLFGTKELQDKFVVGFSPDYALWEIARPDIGLLIDGSFARMAAQRHDMEKRDGSFVSFDDDGSPVVNVAGERKTCSVTQRTALWLLRHERQQQD